MRTKDLQASNPDQPGGEMEGKPFSDWLGSLCTRCDEPLSDAEGAR